MICDECGRATLSETEGYTVSSLLLGDIYLPKAKILRCSSCDNESIALDSWRAIDQRIREREAEAIGKIPVNQFVSGKRAAAMLGMSKQALSKNPRIKNGFIIQRILDEDDPKKMYYLPSVEMYKIQGDGRIRLNEATGDGITRVTIPIVHGEERGRRANVAYPNVEILSISRAVNDGR